MVDTQLFQCYDSIVNLFYLIVNRRPYAGRKYDNKDIHNDIDRTNDSGHLYLRASGYSNRTRAGLTHAFSRVPERLHSGHKRRDARISPVSSDRSSRRPCILRFHRGTRQACRPHRRLSVCYAFGTVWLSYSAGMPFGAALAAGVYPFIPFDLVKIAIAIFLGRTVRRRLGRGGII